MGDTKFIKEIDRVLKEHYGEDFAWDTVFVLNFSEDGNGFISIDLSEDEIHSWQEFLDAKIKAKKFGIKARV